MQDSASPHSRSVDDVIAPEPRRRSQRNPPKTSAGRWLRAHARELIMAIAVVSAIGAALASARPVGLRAADILWCALLGAAVPLIASRARRWALIWTGGVAAIVGIGGNSVGRTSAIALLVLIAVVAFSGRRDRVVAALLGAVAVQALLRGPTYEPIWLPLLVGVIALAPLAWSGRRMARRRERTVATRLGIGLAAVVTVLGIGAMVAALDARAALQAGADSATTGLDLIRAGDTPAAADRFTAGAQEFGRASSGLTGALTWGGRYVPVVGQHVEALRTAARSGESLTRSAAVTASTADYRSLTANGGQIDLTEIQALQPPVAQSAATITAALSAVTQVRSPWLVAPIRDELDRFETKLTDAGEQARLAAEGLAVAPALLGAEGPRRYFLAFSTPSESRDGGGFIGAYGVLTANGGKLELEESGTLGLLNPDGAPYRFDPPPDWELRYGSLLVERFLGNLGASPDWPTDAAVAGQLFPQTPGGVPVDGAMYADPVALAGLLSLTGPIDVPGLDIRLDAQNAENFLLREQYIRFDGDNPQRRELLGDVAQATFDALTSRPLPGISSLTSTLGPLVTAGHLRFSVFDQGPEAFLDRVGLSGAWAPTPGADVLSVRSANMLPNKIDAFLHRDIEVVNDLATSGDVTSIVRVELRNDAPAEGAPRYVIGNERRLPSGTNLTMVTVHSPHQLESVTLDGSAVPVQVQREFDEPVYSVVVELPAGESRNLEFRLAGRRRSEAPYLLEVLSQPTANPDSMSIRLGSAGQFPVEPQFQGPMRGPVLVSP